VTAKISSGEEGEEKRKSRKKSNECRRCGQFKQISKEEKGSMVPAVNTATFTKLLYLSEYH